MKRRPAGIWRRTALAALLALAFMGSRAPAQEYSFEIEDLQKKPYEVGGYAEIQPMLFVADEDAAFHKLRFYGRDEGRILEQYDMTLQLEGAYRKGILRLFARANGSLAQGWDGWDGEMKLYEGFLSLNPAPSLSVDVGKKTLKWGKGYAWNPSAFLDRPKDPEDPDLALEGYFMATADYVRSFGGPLKTFSFTPAVVPVCEGLNEDLGEAPHLNLAAKFYFLFLDTDIDFMFLAGGSHGPRYGVDVSRNIGPTFEVHGEAAWTGDYVKTAVDREGGLQASRENAWSALLGIRYLSAGETTYILEYAHNGTGLSEDEMRDALHYIDACHDIYLSTGDDAALIRAAGLTAGRYQGKNPMKHYVYSRVSQKDPFGILYFIPSFTAIINADDRSFSVSPEFVYTRFTNLELRLKGAILAGGEGTEYGEKLNDARMEFRVRYHF